MAHEEDMNQVSFLLNAIQQHFSSSEIKLILNRCPACEVMAWRDEDQLDLIHHCILGNNLIALMIFLTRGHFKSPYEPATWPYLHLVACLGHRIFISSIIQEMKYQNEAVVLDWGVFEKVVKPNMKTCGPELQEDIIDKKLSPIDLAALFGHIGCLRLLLDFWQVQKPFGNVRKSNSASSLYLLLACQANSSCALRLLLTEHSNKKEALEYALRILAPECVDMVLRDSRGQAELQKAFHGMNLYHVLYSYSSCMSLQEYQAMVEITSILIKHQQSVNALRPSRTLPLYSLLSHSMFDMSTKNCAPFLLACLRLLLEAGADPNLDEISLEENDTKLEQNAAFGRLPHSSAINCFISKLPFLQSPENTLCLEPVNSYAMEVIYLLLSHGADLNFLGKCCRYTISNSENMYNRGTALHLLLSCRPISPVCLPLLQFSLSHGLDAEAAGVWATPDLNFLIKYAINILPLSLWSKLMVTWFHWDKYEFSPSDLELFLYIMRFMCQSAIAEAYHEFLDGIQSLKQLATKQGRLLFFESFIEQPSSLVSEVMRVFEVNTREPWSLQQYCSQIVWKSCQRQANMIHTLPIPGPLKTTILQFH